MWAGDENVADTAVRDVKNLPGTIGGGLNNVKNALPGPDFLAVIDATKGSPTYGKVVNTATVGPLVENEPHHMQYVWHKGDTIYAGALFAAATYAFDVSALPELKLKGVSLPTQTLGGSVPDAYWVLNDGTAYGTYMGGPVAPGPYTYDNGQTVIGNGFAGSPGEVVHFGPNAEVLSQNPAATPQGDDAKLCDDLPRLGQPTCANPHGIQAREDLNTLVTSDYAEPRNIIPDPVKAPSPYLRRPTVRTWDISDRNHPRLKSVSYLPTGPRAGDYDPLYEENRAVMETTVTHLPGHKGAFAESMQGGAVFYTPESLPSNPTGTRCSTTGRRTRRSSRATTASERAPTVAGFRPARTISTCTTRSSDGRRAPWGRTIPAPSAASTCWTSKSWSRRGQTGRGRASKPRSRRKTVVAGCCPPLSERRRSTRVRRARGRTGVPTTTSCWGRMVSITRPTSRPGSRCRTTSSPGPVWTATTRSTC